MKKTLLSIFGTLAVGSILAQTPSPSWQTLQNTSFSLTSASTKFLDVVSSNVVWAIGYDGTAPSLNYNWFTRTTNGGATFTGGNVYADTNTYNISNLEGVDANTAWVASYLKATENKGAIHQTTNGGTSWQNMTAVGMYTNNNSFCNIVSFLTPSVGITMGDPVGGDFEIWRTIDGGTTWTIVPGSSIPNSTNGEYGIVNVYEKEGTTNYWFGTNKGRIFRSTNAGVTWNVSVLPGTPTASLNVSDIAFSSPLNGIAAVYNTSITPSVFEQYVTSNGGVSWTKVVNVSANLGRNDMCGIPGTGVFASAANTTTGTALSYSKDGGITWIDWGSVGIPYVAIDFADGASGWTGTFQSAAATGGIYKFNGPTSIFTAPSTICFTGSDIATPVNMSLGSLSALTYSWNSSPAAAFSNSSVASPTVTFTSPASYTLTLAVSDGTTISNSSQVVSVVACSTPSASFTGSATGCTKITYTVLNTTSNANPTPTYTWVTTPTTGVVISNTTATSPTFTFNSAGVFTIVLTASNSVGTSTAAQVVTVSPCPPLTNFTLVASACQGTLVLPHNTTPSALSYTWSVAPTQTPSAFSNTASANPQMTLNATGIYTVTLAAANISGTASISQTISIVPCSVGLNENTAILSSISVFPNPSNGLFSIENSLTNDNINYVVTNILGSTISSGKFNNTKNVDLSNQSKGIYFITFESKGDKITKKIILE